jgi:hypothetical protein
MYVVLAIRRRDTYGVTAIFVKLGEVKMRARSAMKVTTVRFGADLWRLLESEADYVGVSASQYIREAALARAAAAAAARGEGPFELLAAALREVTRDQPDPDKRAEADRALAALARLTATKTTNQAAALQAQSAQAVRKTQQTNARSEALLDRSRTPTRAYGRRTRHTG